MYNVNMAKRLKIQLYSQKTGESITLPLNPETTDLTTSKEVKTYNLLDYGEVAVRGGKQLKRLTLDNILPDNSTFFSKLASLVLNLEYNPYDINKTVDMINRWVNNDEVIRVIIAGYINAEFTVESFTQKVRESTSDLGYTIELVEYRNPESKGVKYTPKVELKQRKINKYIPAQKIAKAGDTIYKIAKLTYNEKFKELAERNGISDFNLDLSGRVVEMLPND